MRGPDKTDAQTRSWPDNGDVRTGSGIDKGDPRMGSSVDKGDAREGSVTDKGGVRTRLHTDKDVAHEVPRGHGSRFRGGRGSGAGPASRERAGARIDSMGLSLGTEARVCRNRVVLSRRREATASMAESRLIQTNP
ncbi:hypothetical protein C8F04DRAFT_1187945 [Mycena alexandri]|uniref:Uncharacterized protein n=1 Tax=Mycena alexandri TaxID=1745969 RepID=A0AAD6SJI3_9AGAR|nr:hypothetical protein C8F04DRAFT_1187945 [Mycena alexandri]